MLYSFSIYAVIDKEHEEFLDVLGLMRYNLPEYSAMKAYEIEDSIHGFI